MPDRSPAPRDTAPTEPSSLLEGLRVGDPRAFRAVYARYARRLYPFLLRMTHDESEARDLAQDVWLRLATHATRLRPDTDVGAWLFTVARNRFISARRLRVFDRQRLFAWGLIQNPSAPPAPLLAAIESDLQRAVEHALAELALPYREVLLLHVMENFSTKEIARMLDIDEALVRKRLSRARAEVRRRIQEEP